jgi:hypothetical protein
METTVKSANMPEEETENRIYPLVIKKNTQKLSTQKEDWNGRESLKLGIIAQDGNELHDTSMIDEFERLMTATIMNLSKSNLLSCDDRRPDANRARTKLQ